MVQLKDSNGRFLSLQQIVHTLIATAIIAGVTVLGTMRVVEAKMEIVEKSIQVVTTRIDMVAAKLDVVALKQAGVVAAAEEIHKNLENRMATVEKHR